MSSQDEENVGGRESWSRMRNWHGQRPDNMWQVFPSGEDFPGKDDPYASLASRTMITSASFFVVLPLIQSLSYLLKSLGLFL